MWKCNIHESSLFDCIGAVVIWLHAGNGTQAVATFRDCMSIDSFSQSEEGRAAVRLIDAYKGNNQNDIKEVIKRNTCFQFLDACVGRLAVKLPKGNIERMANEMETGGADMPGGEGFDDDDLT